MFESIIIYRDGTWVIDNEEHQAMLDFFAKQSRFEIGIIEEPIQKPIEDDGLDDIPESPLYEKLRANTERLLKLFKEIL